MTLGCHPRFCPRYPIGTCAAGNGGVRSSRDNVPSPRGVAVAARADTATASTTAVGASDGVAWPTQVKRRQAPSPRASQRCCRRTASVVPATHSGGCGIRLGPKRQVVRSGGSELPRRRWRTTGVETRPKPPVPFRLRNVVSPLPCRLRAARGVARRPEGAAGRGGGRKRRPACNGPDRGCDITPPRKRADFPLVSAGVSRQPTGVGGNADLSARPQGPSLVRPPPP